MNGAHSASDAPRNTSSSIIALALGVLAALTALDAIPSIVPLGDDVWMLERPFGSFALEHMEIWGPLARVLNIWLIEAVALSDGWAWWGPTASILTLRALTILGIYLALHKGFRIHQAASLLGAAVFAFTGPAFEGWSLVVTQGLALSAPIALYATALFYRSLEPERRQLRLVVGAAVTFLVALAIYELWIIAVPAFVGIAALASWMRREVRFTHAAVVAAAAGLTAVAWLFALQVTGYLDAAVATRAGPQGRPAEAADLWHGLVLGRMAFLDHHAWRIIEILKTGDLSLWTGTAAGAVGAFSAIAAAVLIGWRLFRHREHPGAFPIVSLVIASAVAAYGALILPALGNPGFPNTSRFYYAPGVFVALACAFLVEVLLNRWSLRTSRLISFAMAGFVLWSAALTRHYLEGGVTGGRILRETAVTIASLPASERDRGVLVIAPSAVGVFSTSAVEAWSIRPAVRRFGGVDPGGILFLGDCAGMPAQPEKVPMHYRSPSGPARWDAVVRHTGDRAVAGPDVATVCGEEKT